MSARGNKKSALRAPKRKVSVSATKSTKSRKRSSAPKRSQKKRSFLGRIFFGFWRFIFRIIWLIGSRVGFVAALILAAFTGIEYANLPPVSDLLDARVRGSVVLLDRNQQVFAWRGEQFGGAVSSQAISPYLKDAVVATEDKRFYKHFGISPRGIASAVRINLSEGRGALQGHGGSTITQQVAKILCLGTQFEPNAGLTKAQFEADCRRTTIVRKLKEIPYSLAMELKFTKDEILTVYLNRVYLGAGSQGFEAASQRYFGKSSRQTSVAQSAMLAGLLVAPSYYAPTRNLQRAQDRASLIVSLMHAQGYLDAQQAQQAKANPAVLSAAAKAQAGGYFADWVMDTGPSFLTKQTTEDVVISTTFDADIQSAAEEALAFIFENKVKKGSKAQAAVVVMSADGAVRAMVGGRETKVSGQFNRATHAMRQTGSAFKPFVYAAALDLGYRFDSIVVDEPITIDVPGSGPWSPKNYTNQHYGEMTLTDALANSINTVAVTTAIDIGLENVRTVAQDFGITSDLAAGPALALGASETTLVQMTGAYAGILNGGRSVTPFGLRELRLQGDQKALMGTSGGMGERVIQNESARQLVYMMSRVVAEGSGRRAQLGDRPVAGKTGTTQAARDAWFIGFTADYVTGVWMGYDDNTPLSGVTGGGLPAEIWHETMTRVSATLPVRQLPMIDPATEAGQGLFVDNPEGAGTGRNIEETILNELLNAIFGNQNN
jgi:penicillin-binding protein 1A